MKYVNLKLVSSLLILWIIFNHYFEGLKEHNTKISTIVINNPTKKPVKVFLTLGIVPKKDSSMWVQDVYGIFGIKSSGSTGMFILPPNKQVIYTPRFNQAIQGNICFDRQKINCPNGTTLVEFCLNNQMTAFNAQETCEISCVAGVSFIASVDFIGGGSWTANNVGFDTITSITNSTIGNNKGLPGVYPYGCDDCTKSVAPPKCVKGKNEAPQRLPICNIQRNAVNGGGTIKINYIRSVIN